jgi:hypothetical protein
VDFYGNVYQVILDDNYDNRVSVPGYGIVERKVAVLTPWKDGQLGTSDDLKSWD